MKNFRIVAHRGASGHAPENTLAAISKAVEFGADAVEVDIHQTKDGRIVVIHDSTLNRTTNGSGTIESVTFDELKKLDAGSWFHPSFKNERIPLLEEALDIVNGNAALVIELKFGSQMYPGIEHNTWEIIRSNNFAGSTVISSTRVTILNTFKSIAPGARLAKIITPKEIWRSLFQSNSFLYKQKLLEHIRELHPHWSFVDVHFMDLAASFKLKVYPWTVNKERKMRALSDRGVHGVITNYPDIAQKMRKKILYV